MTPTGETTTDTPPRPPRCRHDRLTFGCRGCIHRRDVDQLRAWGDDAELAEVVQRRAELDPRRQPDRWQATVLDATIRRRRHAAGLTTGTP